MIFLGTAPFTVNYTINGAVQVPSLTFNTLGTQNQILDPDPLVGNNTVGVLNIIDAEGCVGNIINNVDILVLELPDLDLTISGNNPICYGDNSELSFPILSGSASFNLNILEGSINTTLNIDATGLIGGSPYIVSPANTTTYSFNYCYRR